MPIVRTGTLEPWYHEPRPRCMAEIKVTKEQCTFSAKYEDAQGRQIYLCKTHADMADFPMRLIRPRSVTVREG